MNELSLLIAVQGQNKSLTPYLIAGHLDVVPVVQDEWSYPGFKTVESKNGSVVYARGSIDDKACVMVRMIMFSTSFWYWLNLLCSEFIFVTFEYIFQ